MDHFEGGLLSFFSLGVGAGLMWLATSMTDPAAQLLTLVFGVVFACFGLIGVHVAMRQGSRA